MITQALITNEDYKKSLRPFFKKADLNYNFVNSVEELYYLCLDKAPGILIIQEDILNNLEMIDLIRDLRILFGIAPTIIMLGKKQQGDEIAHYLGHGLDNYFHFPIDPGLFEDYLFKSTKKPLCLPFKYRNVPSGGVPIQIDFNIKLKEINSNGALFESDSLITKGLIFEASLDEILGLEHSLVKLKVLQNSRNDDGSYAFFAEFYQIDDELKKKIVFKLKSNVS